MSRRNSSASNIAIIVFCAFILVHLIFDFNHHIFGRASQKAAQNKEHYFIDIKSEKVSKINEESAKKTENVPKKSERSWNSAKMEEYHKKFIKKLSDSDRKSWMKKIWQTKHLESHENREEVNILWWLQHGKTREARNFDEFKDKCGPCNLVADHKYEKNVDAIIVANSVLNKYFYEPNVSIERVNFPDMKNRNLSQIWVFENKESGIKGGDEPRTILESIDSAFNATMSYRTDSDVTRHFGDAESIISQIRFDSEGKLKMSDEQYAKELIENKFEYGSDYNTAWYVSNCNFTSGAEKRYQFGKKMIEKGLKLYSEGACFGRVTQRQFNLGGSAEFPTGKVKFYLAFENAYRCDDYISEKFWRNSFMNEAIPIMFGPHPDDVKRVAPPNSFIHAEEFDSIDDLLDYMDYLDGNDTAYLEYHTWKNIYPTGQLNPHSKCLQHLGTVNRTICLLCRLVRERRAKSERVSYKSVMKYWKYDVHPECKEGVTFQDYQTKIRRNRISWNEPF